MNSSYFSQTQPPLLNFPHHREAYSLPPAAPPQSPKYYILVHLCFTVEKYKRSNPSVTVPLPTRKQSTYMALKNELTKCTRKIDSGSKT
jgi:hypothetical protein